MVETIELVGLFSLPFFLLLDLVVRKARYVAPRGWRLKAFLATAVTYALSMGIAISWGTLFDGVALLDGGVLGTVGGAIVGVLAYELIHYGYHRAAHKSDVLWRAAHQMHHSAESVDAFGAYWLHPLDTFAFTTISSLVFFPLLGLSMEAGVIAASFVAFNAMFQHANIKTPRWIGFLVQRPESHRLHHARGVHRMNYCDLPLWDMLFGTFENPAVYEEPAGFYPGASHRVGAMLIGKDVSEPPVEKPVEPVPAARRARETLEIVLSS